MDASNCTEYHAVGLYLFPRKEVACRSTPPAAVSSVGTKHMMTACSLLPTGITGSNSGEALEGGGGTFFFFSAVVCCSSSCNQSVNQSVIRTIPLCTHSCSDSHIQAHPSIAAQYTQAAILFRIHPQSKQVQAYS
jgi:hypothetical protein